MKKTKIIVPALGLLLLSTAASVTGTVAWFSANSSVSMTGMKVQAKAESGLLISADKVDSSWADQDATLYSTAVSLVPASTNNATNWYHATSNSADNYAAVGGYKTLTNAADSASNIQVVTTNLATGEGSPVSNIVYHNDNVEGYQNANDTGYYLQTRFYLKSSGDSITINGTSQWLEIQTISLSGISASSAVLDASLRIGVKVDSAFKILAPFAAAAGRSADAEAHTITYNVNGSTSTTAYRGLIATDVSSYKANLDSGFASTIPAKTTDTPLNVDIFLWFEGEDGNCKSNNIVANLDELTVGVTLGLVSSEPSDISGANA